MKSRKRIDENIGELRRLVNFEAGVYKVRGAWDGGGSVVVLLGDGFGCVANYGDM